MRFSFFLTIVLWEIVIVICSATEAQLMSQSCLEPSSRSVSDRFACATQEFWFKKLISLRQKCILAKIPESKFFFKKKHKTFLNLHKSSLKFHQQQSTSLAVVTVSKVADELTKNFPDYALSTCVYTPTSYIYTIVCTSMCSRIDIHIFRCVRMCISTHKCGKLNVCNFYTK